MIHGLIRLFVTKNYVNSDKMSLVRFTLSILIQLGTFGSILFILQPRHPEVTCAVEASRT